MKLKYIAFALAVLSFVIVAGCTSSSAEPEVRVTYVPSYVPTVTVVPSYLPVPSYYPTPSYVPTAAPSPAPLIFSGNGQTASEKFQLKTGLCTFKATNSGDSNFILHLLNDQGKTEEYLFSEIGPGSWSTAVGINKAGIYLLDIDAEGSWTIEVKQ